MASSMDGLTEGRMVHYVLPDSGNRSPGEHRPATVVKVWRAAADPSGPDKGCCNLQVFTDFSNDFSSGHGSDGRLWATSVVYDADKKPGTWHWIEQA